MSCMSCHKTVAVITRRAHCHSATNVITCTRLLLKQMWRLTKAKTKMKREHWTKRWNWSSCTKLALRASWTHGLIPQSVRVSERNSVIVGSNPTQANFLQLLLKIFQWCIPYTIYIYDTIHHIIYHINIYIYGIYTLSFIQK